MSGIIDRNASSPGESTAQREHNNTTPDDRYTPASHRELAAQREHNNATSQDHSRMQHGDNQVYHIGDSLSIFTDLKSSKHSQKSLLILVAVLIAVVVVVVAITVPLELIKMSQAATAS